MFPIAKFRSDDGVFVITETLISGSQQALPNMFLNCIDEYVTLKSHNQ